MTAAVTASSLILNTVTDLKNVSWSDRDQVVQYLEIRVDVWRNHGHSNAACCYMLEAVASEL